MVGWEVQSHLSSITLIALIAFTSIWVALPVMLVWSLIATIAYCHARELGYPSLLAEEEWHATATGAASFAARSAVKAWFAGFHTFAYARVATTLVSPDRSSVRGRVTRIAVLVLGMTLFGVSAAEHLLRRAGYEGKRLVQLGLMGPFLNVPYRVLISALVLHAVAGIFASVDPSNVLATTNPYRLLF